jgi:hypothetical protein
MNMLVHTYSSGRIGNRYPSFILSSNKQELIYAIVITQKIRFLALNHPTFLAMQNRLYWREMNCVMITVCFAAKSWSFTTSLECISKAALFGARIVQDQLLQHLIPQAECSQYNILHICQSSPRRHFLCNP